MFTMVERWIRQNFRGSRADSMRLRLSRNRWARQDPDPVADLPLEFLLVVALAVAAFLLSATGLYALMSCTISQRKREIGIRSALGASAADIVSTVARRAALQVGVGLALGVAWEWVLLHNSRDDVEVGNIPLTLALTVAIDGSVCVAACAHPTLRGLRIQPTEALRES